MCSVHFSVCAFHAHADCEQLGRPTGRQAGMQCGFGAGGQISATIDFINKTEMKQNKSDHSAHKSRDKTEVQGCCLAGRFVVLLEQFISSNRYVVSFRCILPVVYGRLPLRAICVVT